MRTLILLQLLLLLGTGICVASVDAPVGDTTLASATEGWRDYVPGFKSDKKSGSESEDIQGPFVGNISSSSACISWLTRDVGVGRIEYGPTPRLGHVAEESSSGHAHFVWLTGLNPNQTVYYRIDSESSPKSFETASVAAGFTRVVYGSLPQIDNVSPDQSHPEYLVSLSVEGKGSQSLLLSVKVSNGDTWILNLGNLKSKTGEVFSHSDNMTAVVDIYGLNENGFPDLLRSYETKLLSDNLSQGKTLVDIPSDKIVTPFKYAPSLDRSEFPQKTTVSGDGKTLEREFLEGLLNKGSRSRADSRRGHGKPHIIPGWRGGPVMGESKPPKPGPIPNRIHLRGDIVLREILKLRNERTDAKSFFPDVGRHFPELQEKYSRDSYPVDLYQGINIIALPVDPYTPVTSFSFLTDVSTCDEVTEWDGVLQQFGASAIRVGENIIGDDFTFELGYGYFVTMSDNDQYSFEGDPLPSVQYVETEAGLSSVSLVGGLDSHTSFTVFDTLFSGSEICRFNTQLQSYECAFRSGGSILGDEFPVIEGAGYFVRSSETNTFPSPVDITPPSLTIVAPADGDTVFSLQPYIEIIFGDHQWGLNLDAFTCLINGEDKSSGFSIDEFGAIWQMDGTNQLQEGSNTISATVEDLFGNERMVSSTISVVTQPPSTDDHFVNGYVFHGDTWEPLEGVAVTVSGTPGVVFTDTSGHYVFPTQGLGEYRLDIQKEHFTYAQRNLLIEHGHGDEFVDDAFLTPKDSVVTRITPGGGVAVNSLGSILTSFPSGAIDEDIDAVATQYDESEDLPAPLPKLSVFTYCADFGPDGELLDTARIDYFNHRGFASGTPIPLGGYDPETMKWSHEGFAIVESDSTWFEFGLKHFSPHDPNMPVEPEPEPVNDSTLPPDPPGDGNSCPLRGSPSLGEVDSKFGGATVTHDLPSISSIGSQISLSFSYSSRTVKPQIVIETATAGVPADFLMPQYTGAQLNLAGRRFTGIIGPSSDTTRQRIRFDARSANGEYLPTGLYRYNDVLSNFNFAQYSTAGSFGGPPIDSTGIWTDFPVSFSYNLGGDIIFDNQTSSALGSGWVLDGIQRLYFRSDGDAVLIEAGRQAHFYERVLGKPILDLAVTNQGDDDITVLLGDGAGGFGDRQDYPVGDAPTSVIASDFNGDDLVDLAVTNLNDDDVTVLIGNGVGGFGVRQDFALGDRSWEIVTADFNGDDLLDLAATNQGDDDITVLLGDGIGGFGGSQDYAVGNAPVCIVAADFSVDDVMDLAATNLYGNSLTVLLGDGMGGFGNRQDHAVGLTPVSVCAGDFNGDDIFDLAVANQGDDDVTVLLGDGVGGFGDRQDYAVGDYPRDIVAADINMDDILDLAVTYGAWEAGNVTILLGDGVGGFGDRQDYAVGASPWSIVAADCDGDDILDLAVSNFWVDNDASVLLGDGAGSFIGRQDYAVGSAPCGLIAANFNGDYYESGFRSQDGDFTKLTINADSTGYTRIYPDSRKILFDTLGFHIASVDRNGNTTTYEYDDSLRVSTITYPGNLITTIEYATDGKIESATDPADRVTYFDHDLDGNLVSITEPDGSMTRYGYDEDHLLIKIIGPRSDTTTYVYDDNGYVTQIIGADNSTNDFVSSDSYNTLNEAIAQGSGTPENPATPVEPSDLVNVFVNTQGDTTRILSSVYGRPAVKTDVLGNEWSYEYNADGYRTKTIRPDSTVETYTWTEFGKLASLTDSSNGATTTYEYDSVFRQLTSEVNPLGDTTRYVLDSLGNTVQKISPLGDTIFQFFDSTGLLTKSINPLGDSVVYWYEHHGLLDSTMNELGYVTRYEYNAAGNETAFVDPLGNRTEYEYDQNGRLVLVRDPLGRETMYVYDPGAVKACCSGTGSGDLLLAIVNPAGDTTRFEYDEMGRDTAVVDPLGNVTLTEYNSEGREVKTTDAVGRWTSFEYDVAGNLVSRMDSLGRITHYEYDSRNRRTKVIDPLGSENEFAYDGTGNLIHLSNANGDTTYFAYDLLGQKTEETDPLGRTEHFHYGPTGLLDSNITAKGDRIAYIYDDLGRLSEKQFPIGSKTYQYDESSNTLQVDDDDSRLVMTYDANGRMITVTTGNTGNPDDLQPITMIEYVYDSSGQKIAMIDPSNDTTKYCYNLNGSMDSLVEPSGDAFEFNRDKLGRPILLTRPNGTTTGYTYDASGQALSISHRNGTTLIDSLVYTYNAVGMVSEMTDKSYVSEYDYDSVDQVVVASYTDPLLPTEQYEYDPVGNRLSSHMSTSYSYDETNQITEDDQYRYWFDDNGNMIAKADKATFDSTEYSYDYENHLIGVKEYDGGVPPASMEASYSYDGLDRRIVKKVDGVTGVYSYDGANMLREYDENETLIASYANGLRIDQPLKVTRSGSDYYYHADRLGSIRALTDVIGDIAQTYLYDAFGNIKHTSSGSYFSPYNYTGREWNEECGIFYYRARHYDPEVGRFSSNDPIGFAGGDVNMYRYVSSNPANTTDPLGLAQCRKPWTESSKAKEIRLIVSLNLSNKELVRQFDPTWGKYNNLKNLEIQTRYGNTDIDWALTLAHIPRGLLGYRGEYFVAKPSWMYLNSAHSLLKAKWGSKWKEARDTWRGHWGEFWGPAERNAIRMAEDMRNGSHSFSDLVLPYLDD